MAAVLYGTSADGLLVGKQGCLGTGGFKKPGFCAYSRFLLGDEVWLAADFVTDLADGFFQLIIDITGWELVGGGFFVGIKLLKFGLQYTPIKSFLPPDCSGNNYQRKQSLGHYLER